MIDLAKLQAACLAHRGDPGPHYYSPAGGQPTEALGGGPALLFAPGGTFPLAWGLPCDGPAPVHLIDGRPWAAPPYSAGVTLETLRAELAADLRGPVDLPAWRRRSGPDGPVVFDARLLLDWLDALDPVRVLGRTAVRVVATRTATGLPVLRVAACDWPLWDLVIAGRIGPVEEDG